LEKKGAVMIRWRRRVSLFIAKSFQIRYISLILIFMFIIAALTGYTVYVTTWLMFGEKLAAVYPQGLLLDIARKVNVALLWRLAFVTPLVIFIGLVLSNRIAGPIYRIQKYLRRVSSGNLDNELKLRKNDELQDIAGSINDLVSRLRSGRNQRSARIDVLKQKADELEIAIKEGKADKERSLAGLGSILEEIEQLRRMRI
jgi:methyl-accepting chemotaxis protein